MSEVGSLMSESETETCPCVSLIQDERWMVRYQEVMDFMEKNHRNPFKHFPEERNMHSWCHHCRKQINQGLLKPELETDGGGNERYKRVNQYQ